MEEREVQQQPHVKRANRIGVLAIVVSFAAFMLWASFAPLAQGVAAQGTVMLDTKRKQVQHPSGGIVREILVKEGQWVGQDEVLMRLDPLQTQASYEAALQQYLSLRAQESRLLAERSGSEQIRFHESLFRQDDAEAAGLQRDNQLKVFEARRSTRKLELEAIDQSISGLRATLAGTEGPLSARKHQQGLLQIELKASRGLAAEGFLAQQRVRELERSLSDVDGSLTDLEANRERLRNSIAEQGTRRQQRLEDFQRDVMLQLAEVQKEVEASEKRLKASKAELSRIEIKAPVAGQVVGLAIQTVGGVVSGSQKLLEIVPKEEDLLVEAKVPPNFIDRVKGGQHVDVRFTTFANTPQLVVQGKLLSISSDAIDSGMSAMSSSGFGTHYLARVQITADGVKALAGRQLQAGMPVEVVIKTGERSVLKYLLHPIIKRMASSMIEE